MLMLPCSLYQQAALAAATPASVGYDVEADGRRVAKMSAVFREDLFTCTSAKMLFAGFACYYYSGFFIAVSPLKNVFQTTSSGIR